MMKLVLFLTTMMLACTAKASPADFDSSRYLFIDGPITRGTLAPVRSGIEKMVATSHKPITMLISSPGGEVLSGMSLVNYMQSAKAMGVEINCYVLDMAASMAFQIFTQCSTRHALPTSFLLWHGVRTGGGGVITVASARQLADDLDQMDAIIRDQLYGSLHMSKDDIEKHFQAETLWSGIQLKRADSRFMDLEDSYPELIEALPKAVRSAKYNPFSFLFGEDTSIWYIWKNFEVVENANMEIRK